MRLKSILSPILISVLALSAGCSGKAPSNGGSETSPVKEKPVVAAQQKHLGDFTAAQRKFVLGYNLAHRDFKDARKVDLWYTENDGKAWVYYGRFRNEDPVVFEAPYNGTFGYTLTIPKGLTEERTSPGSVKPDFLVLVDTAKPIVAVTAPNGGEVIDGQTLCSVQWTAYDKNLLEDSVHLEFSSDLGASWTLLADGAGNSGSFEWKAPQINSKNCIVRVTVKDRAGNVGTDISDRAFELQRSNAVLSASLPAPHTFVAGQIEVPYFIENATAEIATIELIVAPEKEPAKRRAYIDEDGRSPIVLQLDAGRYLASLHVKDSAGKDILPDSQIPSCILQINPAGGMTLSTFSGKDIYRTSTNQSVEWVVNETGFDDYSTVIEVMREGGEWQTIAVSAQLEGRYQWKLPEDAGLYKLRVSIENAKKQKLTAESSYWFYIADAPLEARLVRSEQINGGPVQLYYNLLGIDKSLIATLRLWEFDVDNRTWKLAAAFPSPSHPVEWNFPDGVHTLALTVETAFGQIESVPVGAEAQELMVKAQEKATGLLLDGLPAFVRSKQELALSVVAEGQPCVVKKVLIRRSGEELQAVEVKEIGATQAVFTVNALPDGPIEVLATVLAADGGEKTAQGLSRIDNAPPIVTLIRSYIVSNNTDVQLRYAISDDASGPAKAEFKLFDSAGKEIRSKLLLEEKGSVALTLEEGVYSYQIVAEDTLGNQAMLPKGKLYEIHVDLTPPALELKCLQEKTVVSGATPFEILWEASDAGFGTSPISLYSSHDGGLNWTPITLNHANSGKYSWRLPQDERFLYTVKAVARDLAGNTVSVESKGALVVDFSEVVVRALGPTAATTRTVNIKYMLSDGARDRLKAVRLYYRTEGAWVEYERHDLDLASPIEFIAPADGVYEILLHGEEKNGSYHAPADDAVAQLTLTIDSTAPGLEFDSGIRSGLVRGGETVILSWKGDASELRKNSVAVEFRAHPKAEWTQIASGQSAEGSVEWTVPLHNGRDALLRVVAFDSHGNLAERQSDPFAIDSLPPQFGMNLKGAVRGKTAVLELRHADDLSQPVRNIALWVSDDFGDSWRELSTSPGEEFEFVAAEDGDYLFYLSGADGVGNVVPAPVAGAESLLMVSIDTGAPAVTLRNFGVEKDEFYAAGTSHYILWRAVDPHLDENPVTLELSKDDGATWDLITAGEAPNDGEYLWLLPNDGQQAAAAKYRVKIVVTDEFGNRAEAVSPNCFHIDAVPPTFTITGDVAAVVQREIKIPVEIGDEGGSGVGSVEVKYRLVGQAAWLDYKPTDPEGKLFTAPDGRYELFIVATDRAGNRSALPGADTKPHFTVNVDGTPPMLELLDAPAKDEILVAGRKYTISYRVKAESNPAENGVSFTLSGGASPQILASGLPNEGSFDFIVPAESADGQQWTLNAAAVDALGNMSTVNIPFRADSTIPAMRVELAEGPIGNKIQLRIAASEDFSGLKAFVLYYRIRGNPWKKLAEQEQTGLVPFEFVNEGVHEFYALGIDRSGNRGADPAADTIAQFSMTWDTVAPLIELVKWGKAVQAGGSTVALKFTAKDINLNPDSVQLFYSTDYMATWKEFSVAPKLSSAELANRAGYDFDAWIRMPLESHDKLVVQVRVSDRNGNLARAETDALALDVEAPEAVIKTADAVQDATVKLAFDVVDHGPAGIREVEIWYLPAGGTWTCCEKRIPAGERTASIVLAQGTHWLSAVAVDEAGNRERTPAGADRGFGEFEITCNPRRPQIEAGLDFEKAIKGGQTQTITWKVASDALPETPVVLFFSDDGGKTWKELQSGLPAEGSYEWETPVANAASCLLKIVAIDTFNQVSEKTSDKPFIIASSASITEFDFDDHKSPEQKESPVIDEPPPQGTTHENPFSDDDEKPKPIVEEPTEVKTDDTPEPAVVSTTDPAQMTLSELLVSAQATFDEGRLAECGKFCELILEKDKKNTMALGMLGEIAYKNQRFDLAKDYLEKAIRNKTVNHMVYLRYGSILYVENHVEDAYKAFSSAITYYKGKDPKTITALYYNLGLTEYFLQKDYSAVASFKTALNNAGADPDATKRCALQLAYSYDRLAQREEKYIEQALHYWRKVKEEFGIETAEYHEAVEAIDALLARVKEK